MTSDLGSGGAHFAGVPISLLHRPAEMFRTGGNFKVSIRTRVDDYAVMSKRTPVTYDEVFIDKYLSSKADRYPEGCSDARKRAIRKFSDKWRSLLRPER